MAIISLRTSAFFAQAIAIKIAAVAIKREFAMDAFPGLQSWIRSRAVGNCRGCYLGVPSALGPDPGRLPPHAGAPPQGLIMPAAERPAPQALYSEVDFVSR
ncbi:MAG TPA: hypothetical protein VH083_16590 [Myxococcales bacterium]|nr:hypothetical protein [Myxococcales bacterium]